MFVGLPPQYMLLQISLDELDTFEERICCMCWENDRTSCDKMMSTERHISFVDEPDSGVGQGKVHPFQFCEQELTGGKIGGTHIGMEQTLMVTREEVVPKEGWKD